MVNRVFGFFLSVLPYQVFSVKGKSMEPSLKQGARLLIKKTKVVDAQEIIALYSPHDKRIIVKRVLWVRDEKHFVIGDNTKFSTDSRSFGSVSKENIIGKVIVVL